MKPYREIIISKRNGNFRKILIPNESLSHNLEKKRSFLQECLDNLPCKSIDHAFNKNKNCATNAYQHLSSRFVLNIDITDFFQNITYDHLKKYFSKNDINICLVENHLPQGFSTSPILSNFAMLTIDDSIITLLKNLDPSIIYSRYADDLTFSFNTESLKTPVLQVVSSILFKNNLKINAKKTTFQDKNNGRAIITGIGVSFFDIHPTRKSLKKYRAAKHQGNINSMIGLKEWCLCKTPIKH